MALGRTDLACLEQRHHRTSALCSGHLGPRRRQRLGRPRWLCLVRRAVATSPLALTLTSTRPWPNPVQLGVGPGGAGEAGRSNESTPYSRASSASLGGALRTTRLLPHASA